MPVDKNDAGIGWTVQTEAALPEVESVPGQEFHVSQLPDPERQAAELGPGYPELWANVGGVLPVHESKEAAAARPGGPEPSDLDPQGVFQKPVDAARAEGLGNNDPEGVGNDLTVAGQNKPVEEVKEEAKSSTSHRRSSKSDDDK